MGLFPLFVVCIVNIVFTRLTTSSSAVLVERCIVVTLIQVEDANHKRLIDDAAGAVFESYIVILFRQRVKAVDWSERLGR